MAYFSNSTDGAILDEQCGNCKLSHDAPCPVLFVQMTYNYDQLGADHWKLREAMNLLIDGNGICQMKKCMDDYITPNRRSTD